MIKIQSLVKRGAIYFQQRTIQVFSFNHHKSNIRHKSLSNVVCLSMITTTVSFPSVFAFSFLPRRKYFTILDLLAFGGFPIIGWIIPIIHLHPQFYPSELVSMLICRFAHFSAYIRESDICRMLHFNGLEYLYE